MATIPFVTTQLGAGAGVAAASPDVTSCDQLVDLFWFYGAAASELAPVYGIGNAHQSIAHAKDSREPLEANAFKYHSGLHGSISGEQGHQPSAHKHQPCANITIAQQCPPPASSSVKWLRRVFDTFDENKDGLLSLEELRRSFEKLGLESSNVHCLLRDSPVSNDKQGAVSHDDFLLLYHGISCKQSVDHPTSHNANADFIGCSKDDAEEDLIWDAFNVFDKDKDGFISPTELQSVLCNLGFGAAKELDACIEMIRGYDQDGNGQVDFEEFKDMLNSAIKLN